MENREVRTIRTMLRRAAGQVSGEPTAVLAQSRSAIARPSSPPLRNNGSSMRPATSLVLRERRSQVSRARPSARPSALPSALPLPGPSPTGLCQPGIRSPWRSRAVTLRPVDVVASLPAFVLAVLLISASPGPAMALIFRRAALRGLRGAVPTVLGLELGLYVWALFAGVGFAALVAASEVAYLVLRVVGAAVLLFLGFRAWRSVWREAEDPEAEHPETEDPETLAGGMAGLDRRPTRGRRRWWGSFAEGVVVQLANPKAAGFMIAFYPQFVPPEGPVFVTTALLGLLQITIETCLYLALAAGVARAGTWFRRPRIRRRLDAVSGTVLVGLGVRIAADH